MLGLTLTHVSKVGFLYVWEGGRKTFAFAMQCVRSKSPVRQKNDIVGIYAFAKRTSIKEDCFYFAQNENIYWTRHLSFNINIL